MISLLVAGAAFAATPLAAHEVTVDHGGSQVRVSYTPKLTTRMKTVGAATGARPTTQRCAWSAAIEIERAAHGTQGAALTKRLDGTRTFAGSRHGDCLVNRVAIARDIERRAGDVRAHVQQVAAADRATLVAELETARALALR